jgi:hypothetical protein
MRTFLLTSRAVANNTIPTTPSRSAASRPPHVGRDVLVEERGRDGVEQRYRRHASVIPTISSANELLDRLRSTLDDFTGDSSPLVDGREPFQLFVAAFPVTP